MFNNTNSCSIFLDYNLSYWACNESDFIIPEVPPNWPLVALCIIPLWIIFGNLMVLFAVLTHKNLRTLSNFVIASLATTDFMLAVFVVPLGAYQTVNGSWDLGFVLCLVWTGCDIFLSTTSILHLAAIAIHRYLAISYPLRIRSTQNGKHVLALLLPSWFVSLAISLPWIVQGLRDHSRLMIYEENVGSQCGIFDRTFVVYSSMVSFFIPLTIMVFADIRSVQILRKNTKISAKLNVAPSQSADRCNLSSKDTSAYELTISDTSNHQTSPCTPIVEFREEEEEMDSMEREMMQYNSKGTMSNNIGCKGNGKASRSTENKKKKKKNSGYMTLLADRGLVKTSSRERRAERTLVWVFICFVVCWLPFFCTNLLYGLCRSCNIPPDVFLAFTWLGYISSGVNPGIYTFLNRDFRNAFFRILTCQRAKFVRRPTG